MNFEDTKWFKLVTAYAGFALTWWLCSLVHLWPFGPSSVAAVAVFGLCLFSARRLVDALVVIAVLAVLPDRRDRRRTGALR